MAGDETQTGRPAPDPTTRRGIRLPWLPIVMLAALAVGLWGIWQTDYDRDVKIVARIVAVALAAAGCGIWFLACTPFSRAVKYAVVFVPLALIAAFLVAFKPEHDGDVKFYWLDVSRYHFRWAPDPDERLEVPDASRVAENWEETPYDYPRFLGPDGRAEAHNVRLVTDWENQPPEETWRRPIGAGWSGFAVVGDYAVTQEQRGNNEMVVCYRVTDGSIVWTHSDATRFDSSHFTGQFGDVGPRATPAIHEGKVVTHGATGIVNCLDARTGAVLWSCNTLREFGGENVHWGKSNSPLIFDNKVVISVGAPGGRSLVAFDLNTGGVVWSAGDRQSSYASPVLATIGGVRQVISLDEHYVTAVRADDGERLWEYPWPGSSSSNASVSQPVPVSGDRVFLSKGYGVGAELIRVERAEDGTFTPEQVWKSSRVMKTKMSNVVIHEGHVYGLDGGILECIELDTGRRKWKARRGRYGHGQILLVGDVIVVMTEMEGDVVLVRATPDGHEELARHQVFDEGQKTWNNPALAGPYLLVRNDEVAACYKLPVHEEPGREVTTP